MTGANLRYSKLQQNEMQQARTDEKDAYDAKKRRKERIELISNKLHAAMWVGFTGLMMYYIDFFRVILESEKVDRAWFNIGVVLFGINTIIMVYLTIWLSYIQKIDLEWSVYCPRAIPTATCVGIACYFSLAFGLWPVWGFLSPIILFIVFVGALMSAHFLPSF